MADRDWYTWHVPRNWRGIARGIETNISDIRLGDRAMRALSKEIREAKGVTALAPMVEVVCRFAFGMTDGASRELDQIAQLTDHHTSGSWELTQIALQAAKSTIVDIIRGQQFIDIEREIRRRFLGETLETKLFAQALPRLVEHRFESQKAMHAWKADFLRAIDSRIEKLTDSFLRHPSGQGLKAPPRVDRQQSTSELLNVGIR